MGHDGFLQMETLPKWLHFVSFSIWYNANKNHANNLQSSKYFLHDIIKAIVLKGNMHQQKICKYKTCDGYSQFVPLTLPYLHLANPMFCLRLATSLYDRYIVEIPTISCVMYV